MGREFHAKRLPVHRGPAAWAEILPSAPTSRHLSENLTADFVIVGGGFAGLSAARRLALNSPGARIVLLEAGRIAEGASGRNSGFMIDLPHDLSSDNYGGGDDGVAKDHHIIRLNRIAIDFARTAASDYQIDPAYFDPSGKVNGAATARGDSHNQSYAAHLCALGEPHELLDAQAMVDLTGSRYYRSGLFTPGSVMLQPAGYIRGLAAGLATSADIFENTPVTGFRKVGPDWQVDTTGAGGTHSITTPRIILANNGHLESFGFARGRLMHVFLFASMTGDLGPDALAALGGLPRWGITPSDPMGTTMRRIDSAQGGNRIVTRTCASFRPDMQSSAADLTRAAHVHRAKFDARFPQLSGAEMQYRWAGHLCLSRNGVSVTGEVADGVFAACCQNGLGTARGTMTGIGAADLALGVSTEISKALGAESPPQKLPPRPIANLGANAVLRWKEWRAGAE